MYEIENKAKGTRTFQVKRSEGRQGVATVTLRPGEKAVLNLVNPKARTIEGLVKSGEITMKASKAKASEPTGDGGTGLEPQIIDKGQGKFAVMQGADVLKDGLTKQQADDFVAGLGNR